MRFPFLASILASTVVAQSLVASDITAEVKSGYFLFLDSTMRDVYQNGGPEVQLTFDYPVWKKISVYQGLRYVHAWGNALSTGESTNISFVTVDVGLKATYPFLSYLDGYISVAPRYFFGWAKNHSHYVDHKMKQSSLGGAWGLGVLFKPYKGLVVDLYIEESYNKMRFHSDMTGVETKRIQVGGVAFGAGLGYRF